MVHPVFNIHLILSSNSSKLSFVSIFLFGIGLWATPPSTPQLEEIVQTATIAYIADDDGLDAIYFQQGAQSQVVFRCETENQIILTPQVGASGNSISFVVDGGNNQRAIHLMGPIIRESGHWIARDSILTVVRGGAWPITTSDSSLYLAMPSQQNIEIKKATDIYRLHGGEFVRLSQNEGMTKHIWPVIDPAEKRLLFRKIPIVDGTLDQEGQAVSIILNLETYTTEAHFVDQNVFLDQWTADGLIMYSYNWNAETRTRVYALYDPANRTSIEIYRGVSRQAKLSGDGGFLASIRPVPEGSAQFDVIVTQLETGKEFNFTQTSSQSESLIGWIEFAD